MKSNNDSRTLPVKSMVKRFEAKPPIPGKPKNLTLSHNPWAQMENKENIQKSQTLPLKHHAYVTDEKIYDEPPDIVQGAGDSDNFSSEDEGDGSENENRESGIYAEPILPDISSDTDDYAIPQLPVIPPEDYEVPQSSTNTMRPCEAEQFRRTSRKLHELTLNQKQILVLKNLFDSGLATNKVTLATTDMFGNKVRLTVTEREVDTAIQENHYDRIYSDSMQIDIDQRLTTNSNNYPTLPQRRKRAKDGEETSKFSIFMKEQGTNFQNFFLNIWHSTRTFISRLGDSLTEFYHTHIRKDN